MTNIVLEMDQVYKKFKKGEIYDSLRDLVPALAKMIVSNNSNQSLEDREFWALKDISFQIKKGDTFGIIGPNGAGKSTILKLLTGIMDPTKGKKSVNGTLSALIEVGAGFHPDLTGRENIFLNGTILGMSRNEIKTKLDAIIEFSGLSDFIDTPVKRYSSGMYARLGFAVASHVNPDILIVDEVLSVGDWAFQNKCMEKMKSIANSGATVVFVSHNLNAVSSLCKEVLLLEKGEAIITGQANEVINKYISRSTENISYTEESHKDKEIYIKNVTVRDEEGESSQFIAGKKAFVDVEVVSKENFKHLSVAISLVDEEFYFVFYISSEQIGIEPFSMKTGDTRTFTFELNLHLATGTYNIGTAVLRSDIDHVFDVRSPAASIFVKSPNDARGIANLYPKLSFR